MVVASGNKQNKIYINSQSSNLRLVIFARFSPVQFVCFELKYCEIASVGKMIIASEKGALKSPNGDWS